MVKYAGACWQGAYIDVSNFNRKLLERAVELSDIPIATNQFEYPPYLNQASLITTTRQAGVAVTAYCAMAIGRVFSEPVLQRIAKRYDKSVSQIILRWLIQQKGVVALSRTEREERIQENLNIFDFALEEADMKAIFHLPQPGSRIRQSARACSTMGPHANFSGGRMTKKSFIRSACGEFSSTVGH